MAATARGQKLENVLGQARSISQVQVDDPRPSRAQAPQEVATSQSPANPSSVPRTYTVQSGDTLSAISKRFYGTPNRWIDIYQANRDRMSSESALRVGQEIRIP